MAGYEVVREVYQTVVVSIGSLIAIFKGIPLAWGWIKVVFYIRNKTYPILPIIESKNLFWKDHIGSLEANISFTVQPRKVPVEIQRVSLRCTGDWFQGVRDIQANDVLDASGESVIGKTLTNKIRTAPYSATFNIIAPASGDTAQITATLCVLSVGRTCEGDIGTIAVCKV